MPRWLAVLGLVAVATVARAEPLAAGAAMPPLRLTDQHDAAWELGPTVRILLVTHDMDGGAIVRETLGDTPQATLDAAGVAYVADVSGMPALVSRLMAVPRMRKRPYRVLLDRDGAATRDVPSEKGRVTVVRLDGGTVASIEQVGDREALRRILFPPAP